MRKHADISGAAESRLNRAQADIWHLKPNSVFLAVLGLGFVLRIFIFAAGRMMWQDEAMLAINLATRSGSALMEPLTFTQIAPIGWLYLTDWLHATFGNFEYAARLPGLVASCLSLWIFSRVCLKLFSGYVAVIVLTLFAINGTLVDYAAQLKPYAFDVLLAVTLLWFVATAIAAGRLSLKAKLLLLAVCILGAVSTFTAPFVIGGIGGALLLKYTIEKDWREFASIALICAIAGGIFLTLGLTLYQGQAVDAGFHSGFAKDYFANQYAPFPPTHLADVSWYVWWLLSVLELFAGFQSAYVWLAFALVGLFCVLHRNVWLAAALIFPVLISLLLSMPKIYPVLPRVNLYYIPILIILIGECLRRLMANSKTKAPALGIVLCFILLAGSFWNLRDMSFPNFADARRDVSGEMMVIAENYQDGDTILVARNEIAKFLVYRQDYGLQNTPWGMSELREDCHRAFFQTQESNSRVWLFKSHKTKRPAYDRRFELVQSRGGLSSGKADVFMGQLDLITLRQPLPPETTPAACAMPFRLNELELLGGAAPIWPAASMWKRD